MPIERYVGVFSFWISNSILSENCFFFLLHVFVFVWITWGYRDFQVEFVFSSSLFCWLYNKHNECEQYKTVACLYFIHISLSLILFRSVSFYRFSMQVWVHENLEHVSVENEKKNIIYSVDRARRCIFGL